MSVAVVLVVVFSAVALGLSAFALYVSLGARATAREAHDAARALASAAARRRREQPEPVEPDLDDREVNLGPPRETGERRQEDAGPAGRHRPPETGARYSRLRASADAREAAETTAIPAVGRDLEEEGVGLPTAEHPAPTSTYRRPPPPLPRPGSIGRQQ